MAEPFRPVAPVDPTNLRPILFLEAAREIMLSEDWPYRAVSVVMESHTGPGRFSFYGANHPAVIDEVHERRVDVSTLNPAALLTMAHRGTGAFDSPREVATIAVLPHDDQLGRRDQLRPAHAEPSVPDGAPRAWRARRHLRRGCHLVGGPAGRGPVPPAQLRPAGSPPEPGLPPGPHREIPLPPLASDVTTVDYSGWPIYCRTDTPDDLVGHFCQALVVRREHIPWDIGGVHQPPLPLERMVHESPATPQDVPMHPRSAAVWQEHGFLP
jgi:hypothetical protein